LITDEDIRRIQKLTGQPANEIADFYTPTDIEWGLENSGWIELDSGWHIMALIRKEDGCQYLGEDDLCEIYENRPVTCHRYPFDVEFDSDGELSLLGINGSVECPYELDGHYEKQKIKALVEWEDQEEQPYFKLVEAWNKKKKPGGPEKFLSHLNV
jgi:Fe-S-cluster containining protein